MSRPHRLDPDNKVKAEPPAVKEIVVHNDGWPKLDREGLATRLAADSGFDDATYLRVRPQA